MVLLKTLAHQILSQKVNVGDIVIDATTGNGNDTLLLARKVGATGRVFGFDIQPKAITATTKRLTSMYNLDGVTLIQACHTLMPSFIPQEYHGRVKAITFNLGYLPGGDPQIITQPLITCQAIQGAITLLAPTGIITILAYQGHEGGSDE
ncbi:MAG: methyltransferase domain-containing protein, partial [Bdellovibrionales bacterium]|nr:methyltransferase domain-containing protein [Bdellovibrionales bacterium]